MEIKKEGLPSNDNYQKKPIPKPVFVLAIIISLFGAFLFAVPIIGLISEIINPSLFRYYIVIPLFVILIPLGIFITTIGISLFKLRKEAWYGSWILFLLFAIYFFSSPYLTFYFIGAAFVIGGPIILWLYRKQFK